MLNNIISKNDRSILFIAKCAKAFGNTLLLLSIFSISSVLLTDRLRSFAETHTGGITGQILSILGNTVFPALLLLGTSTLLKELVNKEFKFSWLITNSPNLIYLYTVFLLGNGIYTEFTKFQHIFQEPRTHFGAEMAAFAISILISIAKIIPWIALGLLLKKFLFFVDEYNNTI